MKITIITHQQYLQELIFIQFENIRLDYCALQGAVLEDRPEAAAMAKCGSTAFDRCGTCTPNASECALVFSNVLAVIQRAGFDL